MLVLDEATSSVDTETELLIRDALKVVMRGRTTIAIAHRLFTIQDMERILVLHKGKLRESGTHQELLAHRGIYATVCISCNSRTRSSSTPDRGCGAEALSAKGLPRQREGGRACGLHPPARPMSDYAALEAVRHAARWFSPTADGSAPLLDLIGDARIVLIGEGTHGTDEFYRIRADLTTALIRGKQFNIVAAEADWPDAYRGQPVGSPQEFTRGRRRCGALTTSSAFLDGGGGIQLYQVRSIASGTQCEENAY